MSSKIISSATVPASSTWMRLSSSLLRHQEAVLLGPLHRVAQGRQAARNDRDLVDRVGVRQRVGDQGVAAFVVGDAELFVLVHDALLLFEAGGDALDRLR